MKKIQKMLLSIEKDLDLQSFIQKSKGNLGEIQDRIAMKKKELQNEFREKKIDADLKETELDKELIQLHFDADNLEEVIKNDFLMIKKMLNNDNIDIESLIPIKAGSSLSFSPSKEKYQVDVGPDYHSKDMDTFNKKMESLKYPSQDNKGFFDSIGKMAKEKYQTGASFNPNSKSVIVLSGLNVSSPRLKGNEGKVDFNEIDRLARTRELRMERTTKGPTPIDEEIDLGIFRTHGSPQSKKGLMSINNNAEDGIREFTISPNFKLDSKDSLPESDSKRSMLENGEQFYQTNYIENAFDMKNVQLQKQDLQTLNKKLKNRREELESEKDLLDKKLEDMLEFKDKFEDKPNLIEADIEELKKMIEKIQRDKENVLKETQKIHLNKPILSPTKKSGKKRAPSMAEFQKKDIVYTRKIQEESIKKNAINHKRKNHEKKYKILTNKLKNVQHEIEFEEEFDERLELRIRKLREEQKNFEEMRPTYSTVWEDKKKVEIELKAVKADLENITNEYLKTRKNKGAKEAELERVKSELEYYENELGAVKNRDGKSDLEIESSIPEFYDVKDLNLLQLKAVLRKKKEKNDREKKEIGELRETVFDLKRKRDRENEQIGEINDQLYEVNKELEEVRMSLFAEQGEAQELTQKIIAKEAKVKGLEEEQKDLFDDLDLVNETTMKIGVSLASVLLDPQRAKEATEKEIERVEEEIREREEELRNIRDNQEVIDRKISDFGIQKKQFLSLQRKLKESESELMEEETEVRKLREELRQKRKEMDSKKEKIDKDEEHLSKQIRELQANKKQANKMLEEIMKKEGHNKDQKLKLVKRENELKKQKHKLNQGTEELEQLKGKNDNQMALVKKYEEENNQIKDEIEAADKQYKIKLEEIKKKKMQIEEEVNSMKSEEVQRARQREDLEKSLKEKEEKDKIEQEKREKELEENIRKAKEDYQERKKYFEDKNNDIESKLKDVKKEMAELEKVQEDLDNRIDKAEKQENQIESKLKEVETRKQNADENFKTEFEEMQASLDKKKKLLEEKKQAVDAQERKLAMEKEMKEVFNQIDIDSKRAIDKADKDDIAWKVEEKTLKEEVDELKRLIEEEKKKADDMKKLSFSLASSLFGLTKNIDKEKGKPISEFEELVPPLNVTELEKKETTQKVSPKEITRSAHGYHSKEALADSRENLRGRTRGMPLNRLMVPEDLANKDNTNLKIRSQEPTLRARVDNDDNDSDEDDQFKKKFKVPKIELYGFNPNTDDEISSPSRVDNYSSKPKNDMFMAMKLKRTMNEVRKGAKVNLKAALETDRSLAGRNKFLEKDFFKNHETPRIYLKKKLSNVCRLDISRDGKTLYTGGADGLWVLEVGARLEILDYKEGKQSQTTIIF